MRLSVFLKICSLNCDWVREIMVGPLTIWNDQVSGIFDSNHNVHIYYRSQFSYMWVIMLSSSKMHVSYSFLQGHNHDDCPFVMTQSDGCVFHTDGKPYNRWHRYFTYMCFKMRRWPFLLSEKLLHVPLLVVANTKIQKPLLVLLVSQILRILSGSCSFFLASPHWTAFW